MHKQYAPTSTLFSLSIFCLAGALAYFSYAITETVRAAPELVEQVRQTALEIDPVLEEMDKATTLIPAIISEVELVRQQIPLVLSELKAIRLHLPAVLSEVTQTRQQIPAIILESQGYRRLIPEILKEVETTRTMLPATLSHAEKLIRQASRTGQKASEGAVAGLLTGVIKAPFKMVGGISRSIFGHKKGLSQRDLELMTLAAQSVLYDGAIGNSKAWSNTKTSVSGKITLTDERDIDARLCRTLEAVSIPKGQAPSTESHTVCLDDEGMWELAG